MIITNSPVPDTHARAELIALFRTLVIKDNAKDAQAQVAALLEAQGYDVKREATVGTPGAWSHGRIDVLATRNGELVAIEIDHRRPRNRSIYKLRTVQNAHRMILLRLKRRNRALTPPGGIHAVIGLYCPEALH